MQAGYEVDKVLEMTDNMTSINAYHFTKNYPNIEIVKPSVWNSENYLESLKEKYDVVFGNPPCSGLSSINRNASADNDINDHIFEFTNVVNKVRPKVFLMENAPTLVKLGLPILKEMQSNLTDYRLTIITDCAGNHNVPMQRRRTLVIGWRRDVFSKIPQVDSKTQPMFTVEQALEGLTNESYNMEFDNTSKDMNLMRYYNLVGPSESIMKVLATHIDSLKDLTNEERKHIQKFKDRMIMKKSVWDKSAWRLPATGLAPSMASVVQFIHPTENRDLYIREYARLMGYPDDFKFYQDECQCPTIQCLAQGVPVNFIKYIATEIKSCLTKNKCQYNCDVLYINQTNGIQKYVEFTTNQFQKCKDISVNDIEQSLWD